jgi:hypothetical protein
MSRQTKENIIAILFTIIAIGFNFWYMGLLVIFLNIGLAVSFILWVNFKNSYSKRLSWLYIAGILIQLSHFLEEYYTGFYKALPTIFNANSWTGSQFIIFNIVWLIIFLLAAIGAIKNIRLSFLIVWFFIFIGGVGNGIMHIGLSLIRKEYFSGTVTAFFLFVIGLIMIKNITGSSMTIGNR